MSENDVSLYNGCLVMAIIGGICYFYVMVYKVFNFVREFFMNIFGGGPGSESKRVRCDGSDSQLETVKARDVFSGLVKDGYEAENFGEQVGEVVDASYEFENDGRVHGMMRGKDYKGAENQVATFTAIMNENEMRNGLNILVDVLISKQLDDIKWENINNAYCQLSAGKERRKAEVLRHYFRKLDTVFKRKDGTIYSKIVSANEAQDVIEELIEVYPWDVPVKSKTKYEPAKADKEKDAEIASLKDAVNNMAKIIEQINNRLEKA